MSSKSWFYSHDKNHFHRIFSFNLWKTLRLQPHTQRERERGRILRLRSLSQICICSQVYAQKTQDTRSQEINDDNKMQLCRYDQMRTRVGKNAYQGINLFDRCSRLYRYARPHAVWLNILDKLFPVICQQESLSRKEKSNIKSGQKKERKKNDKMDNMKEKCQDQPFDVSIWNVKPEAPAFPKGST